ncbi:hypothetical protein [Streptomyces sp. NRRL F-5053]|uniref:hypothetical protein n=1 Tax=Streptomyces sp. NRRL F-5053 TaxID=1463854 RepID=UPI000A8E34C4|nr:hypothetical protein [Streptomyces sp. NRRL F-5053]
MSQGNTVDQELHTITEALRETQLEQGQRLDALEAKVDDGFAKTSAGLQEILRRLPAQA